jgi:hypothetical protein
MDAAFGMRLLLSEVTLLLPFLNPRSPNGNTRFRKFKGIVLANLKSNT